MTEPHGRKQLDRIGLAERRREALRLRRLGHGYREIGEHLGIGTSTAYDDVRAELREIPREERDEMIALTALQIDMAITAMMPAVGKGSVTAVAKVIALIERRCRLFGLDAPTQVHIENGVNLDELRQHLNDLLQPDADTEAG